MHGIGQLNAEFRGTIDEMYGIGTSGAPRLDDFELAAMARAALNYLRGNPEPARGTSSRRCAGWRSGTATRPGTGASPRGRTGNGSWMGGASSTAAILPMFGEHDE